MSLGKLLELFAKYNVKWEIDTTMDSSSFYHDDLSTRFVISYTQKLANKNRVCPKICVNDNFP